MSRLLRWANVVPRPLARSLRDAGLALLDRFDRLRGRSDEMIPPRSIHYVGGGDFREIGRRFLSHFIELAHLQPHESVLDIGCGSGRMAVPLLDHLDEGGRYLGFDVSGDAVRWCREHLSPRNSRFQFLAADVLNPEYNPRGRVRAEEYTFPCDTGTVDFAFATSVFTHMPSEEVKRYLDELRRVLRLDGRALLTFFLIDSDASERMRRKECALRFERVAGAGYWTIDPRAPERAIAYEENDLREMLTDAGLAIAEPIRRGSWSGRRDALEFQDVVLVTPRPQ